MGPEVADEANPGEEASPTGRTEVGRGRAVGAGGSGLACCTFLLCLKGPALLCCGGTFGDEMAPRGSVRGQCLPGFCIDLKVIQGDLQTVFETYSLPSN